MPALAHRHGPLPEPPRRPPARLRAVPAARGGRVPSARALALYALGLVAGFLLAGLASLPGGAEVVSGQLGLAARRRCRHGPGGAARPRRRPPPARRARDTPDSPRRHARERRQATAVTRLAR